MKSELLSLRLSLAWLMDRNIVSLERESPILMVNLEILSFESRPSHMKSELMMELLLFLNLVVVFVFLTFINILIRNILVCSLILILILLNVK